MSDMKNYINQFRVSAGLSPDDRVLTEEALLSEDKETNEMERVLMAVMENAAKSRGEENWGRQTVEWTEKDSAGDPEDGRYSEWDVEVRMEVPVAAARPTVVRRKDGSFAVVFYMFAAPGSAGKIERNMGALAAASKKGLPKKLVEARLGSPAAMRMEPSLEPPDYGGDDVETREYEYGDNYGIPDRAMDRLEEIFSYYFPSEILPAIAKKAFPQMVVTDIDSRSGGKEPSHYCWAVSYLKPKK